MAHATNSHSNSAVRDRQAGSTGNVIAALSNFFVPGLGQLIQGRIVAALTFFLLVAVGSALWFLIVPAIIAGIAYIWSIIDAARWTP